jgi:hypothetical protein
MVTSLPSYAPNTFIPGGMIWGLNSLAPDGPFRDGMPYDDQNQKPRKVVVLMTDGANTLLYNKNNGKAATSASKLSASERQPYVAPTTSGNCGSGNDDKEDDTNGNAQGCKKQGDAVGTGTYAQTNEDTLAICTNMKAEGTEIFTVAFMVEDEVAKSMLKGCATSHDHFYSASNAEVLSSAFSGIAGSLQVVRLAR